ncbi:expressed unknown protein [Seminavis robusta]|uniref:Uncharacterized protein n=1 Tax=Seminavis robusta TaxID=568900 RepID=A0A9N8HCU9_9STRA|nr:expressed unknown protein [Seminavis robusta]|eukprot:Sro318_g115851.1  (176) ;mRNA; f:7268-7795
MSLPLLDSLATPTSAASTENRPLPSLNLKKRTNPTSSIGNSRMNLHARAKSQERKHLIRTAPRVPDTLGGDGATGGRRVPAFKLRMRPSSDPATRTPVQRVSFVPLTAPVQSKSSTATESLITPAPVVPLAHLPTNLLFPDIPSSGSSRRRFVLKPKKPLATRSYQSQVLVGAPW